MAGVPDFRTGPEPAADAACGALANDLAAYSWGALEPDERARLDSHRAHCSACDLWLQESAQTISKVDLALPRQSPPPELRARVLTSIDWTPQAVAPVRPTKAVGRETRPARPRPVAIAANAPAHAAQRGARLRGSPFLAGLATGLFGALGTAALAVVLMVHPQALTMVVPPGSEFGSSPSSPPAPPPVVVRGGLAQSAGRLVELRSLVTSGHAWLMYDTDSRRGVLLLEDMPAPEGTEYTVWLAQGSWRVGVGSTVTDARGVGTFVLPEPLPLDHPDRIEVGPSTGTAPVLSGSF